MPVRVIHPEIYKPTTPRSGDISDNALFRMTNAIIKGFPPLTFVDNYGGSLNLSETIASSNLTGTLALTSGSTTVTGTATAFVSELHLGEFVLVVDAGDNRSFLLVVEKIVSDTVFLCSKALTFTGTTTGETGARLPILFPLDVDRGTMIRGNAVRLDLGTILSVGDGVFRINGSAISASLTTTRSPKISLFNSGAGTYTNFTLGMNQPSATITAATNATPAVLTSTGHLLVTGNKITISGGTGNWAAINSNWTVTVTGANTFSIPVDSTTFGALTGTPTYPVAPKLVATAGGNPGMQAGTYSIVIAPARTQTLGYNNPGPRADVTLATGDMITITVPPMDTVNGQNAWDIYGTLFSDTLGADLNYLNGPWHFVIQNSTISSAGGSFTIEWLDAEIERYDLITFDNDPPPKSEFIALLNNVPVWISNYGPGGTSPGPFISPAKPNNIEAAPAVLAFSSSPPEIIYGVVSAAGRLYLLTSNHLCIAQGTPSDTTPILIQPYWKSGFKNPYQIAFVNGRLYGYPVSGPTRSASEGSEGSEEKSFAADVQEIVATWTPGQVMVAHDPSNDAICYFHCGDSLNSSGFWTTRILMFGLRQDVWIGDVTLSSTTQDMIVTGVATIGANLNFLAGGRLANNSTSIGTYQFDAGTSPVAWSAAAQYSDNGIEQYDKVQKSCQFTGKATNGTLKVYGAGATQEIEVTGLTDGTGSLVSVSTSNTTNVAVSQRYQINCPNITVSTLRIDGTWPGSGNKDRLDEFRLEWAKQGVRR